MGNVLAEGMSLTSATTARKFESPSLTKSHFVQDRPHYRIETNNLIESWHYHLKWNYLCLMRKQRLDVLVHILTDKVEPDYRRLDIRVSLGFENSNLSRVEYASRKAAESVD